MKRSFEQELMEDSSFNRKALKEAVKTIDRMNWLLGSFKPIVNDLRELINDLKAPVTIVDIGAGSGYFGRYLTDQFDNIKYFHIEPSREIISMFNRFEEQTRLRGRCPGLPFQKNSVDICISTLVLHHVEDGLKNYFLRDTLRIAKHRVIHHDLLRNIFAYYGAKILTRIMSKSLIARHDGPLSVRRSMTVKEWEKLLTDKISANFDLKRSFPYRINLVGNPDQFD